MESAQPDMHLYGVPRPKREPKSTIKPSTSHSFASSLSSLLANPAPNKGTTSARIRPSKNRKDDIFTTHNKGAKRRAADDILDKEYTAATGVKHKADLGNVDYDTLYRSKRKMEEKARIYAAMKRGDYVSTRKGDLTEDSGPLVDFDRKWAELQETGKEEEDTDSDDGGDSEEETIEYTDEFGRTRTGTKSDVQRELQRQRITANAETELAEMSARPSLPRGMIIGDAIQSAAFKPDAAAEKAMHELAAKRDRSATPPEETHYDATKEVRSKGVGFYQFSKDKASRENEFKNLEKERADTLWLEKEREDRKQKKAQELEERKRKIHEKRSQKQADNFLSSLDDAISR